MTGWYLGYLEGRTALVNGTGRSVYDVHISSHGRMVISGQRDWTFDEPEVVDGGVILVRYGRAQGAHQDPPFFRIEYGHKPGDEDRSVEVVDAPWILWARSRRAAPALHGAAAVLEYPLRRPERI